MFYGVCFCLLPLWLLGLNPYVLKWVSFTMQAFKRFYSGRPLKLMYHSNDIKSYFILLKALMNAMASNHVWSTRDEYTAFVNLVNRHIEDGKRVLKLTRDDPFYVSQLRFKLLD